jgi:hypothetical protein
MPATDDTAPGQLPVSPLWELWFIDGVENDRIAILTKAKSAHDPKLLVFGAFGFGA